MPPKGKKAGKNESDHKKNAPVTEVDKVFFELQMADCNRKLARLRSAVDEYEQRNEDLQKAYDKLDEDRADIIAFLKKTLNQKNEENSELKEKVKGLEETREIETKQFQDTVAELEKNFNFMKDQLTSENKLMAGKLNTLEEFRAIRDDLMKKFESQEKNFKEQELLYKRKIYDAEKKFVVGKDKLKKEMEARLLQLAQDFQDATELRIAASTHRVIRENIAINNELDTILQTQAKLAEQNEKFKENERAARVDKELAEEERDKAINKNVVQLKVIDQLTKAFQDMKKEMAQAMRKNTDIEKLQAQLTKLHKENENLALQVRILEQNLHAKMCAQNKSLVEADKVLKENKKLRNILKEAATAIQASLKMDEWATEDPAREVLDRQVLLSRLLEIITQYRDLQRGESIDTLASLGKVYEEGDLGFIPKIRKKKIPSSGAIEKTLKNKEEIKEERTTISSSLSSSTVGSLATIPSVNLVPPTSKSEVAKSSWPSFKSSSKSISGSFSSSQRQEGEASEVESSASSSASNDSLDIKKMLAQSKAELHKSLKRELQKSQATMESIKAIDASRKQSMTERKLSLAEKRKSLSKPILSSADENTVSNVSLTDEEKSSKAPSATVKDIVSRVSFSVSPDAIAAAEQADKALETKDEELVEEGKISSQPVNEESEEKAPAKSEKKDDIQTDKQVEEKTEKLSEEKTETSPEEKTEAVKEDVTPE